MHVLHIVRAALLMIAKQESFTPGFVLLTILTLPLPPPLLLLLLLLLMLLMMMMMMMMTPIDGSRAPGNNRVRKPDAKVIK